MSVGFSLFIFSQELVLLSISVGLHNLKTKTQERWGYLKLEETKNEAKRDLDWLNYAPREKRKESKQGTDIIYY